MKNLVYKNIEKSISKNRLSTYIKYSNCKNNNDVISNYIINTKLSENFYFLLQNLEVALRNSIYDSFEKYYIGKNFFYLYENNSKNRYMSKKEKHSRNSWKMLCGVKYKLNKITTINDGKIIAELNFGFWTELLLSKDKKYSNMWRKIFKDVFPNYKIISSIDNEKIIIANKINTIRKFRNRIFHYEPIFHNKDLDKLHNDILNVIYYLNIDLYNISKEFDMYKKIKLSKKKIMRKINKQKKYKNENN